MANDAAADYTRAGYATAKHVLPDLSDPDSKAGLLEHLTKSKRTWLPTGRLAPLTGMPSKLHPDKIGFTDMPGEVRNQIYELALLTKFNHTAPAYEKRTRHRIPIGLLLGCRQIYEETKDTWYEENVFVEIITNWADLPEQFAAMGVPYFARQDGSTLKAGTRLQQRLKKPDITVYMVSIHQSRELQSQYWMAAEDLPTFAAAMVRIFGVFSSPFQASIESQDMFPEQKALFPLTSTPLVLYADSETTISGSWTVGLETVSMQLSKMR